tara:strand:- start:299 stop:538 length:240 start_codon:yes stop_codon:yes gene_type:complete
MKVSTTFNDNNHDYEVHMDTAEGYGWFELCGANEHTEDEHAEGGIWCEGMEITDYDGVYEMPKPIIDWLEEQGFDISWF